jgi:hypothetical protein
MKGGAKMLDIIGRIIFVFLIAGFVFWFLDNLGLLDHLKNGRHFKL